MSVVEKQRALILMRHSPYGASLARASIDLALAMGAFEQDFDLLFMGPGVLQLLKDQHSEALGLKNAGKTLSALPLYDIDTVYVDAASLQRYGLAAQDLVLAVNVLDQNSLSRFLNDCKHVLSC